MSEENARGRLTGEVRAFSGRDGGIDCSLASVLHGLVITASEIRLDSPHEERVRETW